ncbi:D-erythrulose kinase, partial [Streptomyces celluloflavus]
MTAVTVVTAAPDTQPATAAATGSTAERATAADLPATAALQAAFDLVAAHEAELGRLDAVGGDRDHRIGSVRG